MQDNTALGGAENDRRFMNLALSLADCAKGSTFPNPAVGAVVVKNGKVAGQGATSSWGGPHAEKTALAQAGARARGATLYATLEPCNHTGRTPPCTDAIIAAGICRVVASVKDPNPLVNGKGLRKLSRAGIDVSLGLLSQEATRLNEDFFYWVTHKRPWISVKLAMTLDGRIADAFGESKWITSAVSRNFVHDIRRRHGAIAVGRHTLERDNPKLTVRHEKIGNPVRFVFSSKIAVSPNSYFVKNASSNSRSILVKSGGKACLKQKLASGIEVWRTGITDRAASLNAFLEMASGENITSVLIEGGGSLASSFLENNLVNRVYLFYANKILGGGVGAIGFENPLALSKCMMLSNVETVRFGNDTMITGIPETR
jgi:diaminohydroxyphosphoribosylaminopyrimidine deaminase/5-amino-6-(5-phosphoribosylamino)uracil reductase